MNLILLFESDFVAPGQVRLGGRRLEHVRQVIRPVAGETLTVGLCDGQIGEGTITSIDGSSLEMHVALDRQPPPPAGLTLILSLPRPNVLSRVIATVTAMGIKRIYLINSWKVEKGFWDSPRLSKEKLYEQMVAGLEQAKDTVMPSIELRKRFRPFVEDELPSVAAGSRRFVAHPGGARPCPAMVEDPVTLAVGPEGGYTDWEVGLLEECGFEAVHCGERILRVESVIPALIGRLGA